MKLVVLAALLILVLVISRATWRKLTYKSTEIIHRDGGVVVVVARDSFRNHQRREEIIGLFDGLIEEGVRRVVVDLTRVEKCYDDGAFGPVFSLGANLKKQAGKMALVRPQKSVYASYAFQPIKEIEEILPNFDSRAEALAYVETKV